MYVQWISFVHETRRLWNFIKICYKTVIIVVTLTYKQTLQIEITADQFHTNSLITICQNSKKVCTAVHLRQ
jgi:hypothetical protein